MVIFYTMTILSSVFFTYNYLKTKNKIYLLLIAGFMIRIVFIWFDNSYQLFPYNWDTNIFRQVSEQIRTNILNYNLPFNNINESIHVTSYSFIQSLIYLITNNNQLSMRVVNSFIASYSGIYLYKISKYIFKKESYSFITTALFLFWPSFILYTAINMREAIIIYLTLYILSKIQRFKLNFNLENFILLFHLIFLFLLKIPNIVFFIVLLITYLILNNSIKKNIDLKTSTLLIVLFIFVGLFLIQSGLIPTFGINDINDEMKERTIGGAKYLSNMSYDNVIDLIRYLPNRFVHFLFGPFFNTSSIFFIFGSIDGFLILLMFINYIYILFKNKIYKNSYQLILILFFFTGILGNAVFDANYGTALRHRMPYIIILFIYITPIVQRSFKNAANGFNSYKRQKR